MASRWVRAKAILALWDHRWPCMPEYQDLEGHTSSKQVP